MTVYVPAIEAREAMRLGGVRVMLVPRLRALWIAALIQMRASVRCRNHPTWAKVSHSRA
jgi:hypothetical protein